jgi:sn-glycerol 3-phosphate transport system ATP-binding protein
LRDTARAAATPLPVQASLPFPPPTAARANATDAHTAAAPRYAVRLRGLQKGWNGQAVIQSLDLDIPEGHFVALLGPSGCGKSTTLRLIAGLEQPDAGTVEIHGRDVTAAEPSARGLSMVFQSYALFPHLSVADNIDFGMRVRGVPAAERAQRLREAVALTGLAGLETRKPAALSGGQRQRVALARALVAGHRLCLMDEPLSNLDARLRLSVRQEIRALQQKLGMTVVYVTHDQTEAMGMADTVVLMQGGRIVQRGTPRHLYREPATVFAASFVGTPPMALFPDHAVPAGLWPGAPIPDALVGVRPEDLRFVPPGPDAVNGIVQGWEFQGAESYVYVAVDGIAPVIVRTAHMPGLTVGQAVGLGWLTGATRLFDRASGRALSLS